MTIPPRFIAAGEALTDLLATGPTAWRAHPAGAAWNVARAMARLGMRSAFAGAVSRDVFGNALAAATAAAGLDPRFLQQVDRAPLLAVIDQGDPPRYVLIGNDSADLHFDATCLPEGWDAAAEWAHFGGISLAREPLAAKLIGLAERLKALGVRISYAPNFRQVMDQRYDTLRRMVQLADVVKVSAEDLRGLFRQHDTEPAFAALQAMNPDAAYLLTCGERGARLHLSASAWQATPPRVQVADSVGADDASLAAFLFSLMTRPGIDGSHHLRFAVAAGAAACRLGGASPPSLQSVEALLNGVGLDRLHAAPHAGCARAAPLN